MQAGLIMAVVVPGARLCGTGYTQGNFRSLFSTSDTQKEAIHFIKQMLRENGWMDCTATNCAQYRKNKHPCPMPTKQFYRNIMIASDRYKHDVPIFQIEVAGEKKTGS